MPIPPEVQAEFEEQLDDYIESWTAQMLVECGPTVSESFNDADHPRGQPANAGQFGPGGGSSDAKADDGAQKIDRTLKAAAGLKGKMKAAFGAVKGKALAVYQRLEKQHGRTAAIAILAAGHALGLATPLAVVPGSTFLATAACAYAYDLAKRGLKKAGVVKTAESGEDSLTDEEIQKAAKELIAELVKGVKEALEG